ncbi:MAG TPA: hypothetical protein VLJ59_13320 [Mycobacteriales bacterium]|nr:hypothetical protein [Mycobacteriales bacterium]
MPLAQAPGLPELAGRARTHERITLTEARADSVIIMSAGDHRAILDWEAAFIAEGMSAAARGGSCVPHELVVALDDADPTMVEAFLAALEARADEDIPPTQQWAMWERINRDARA